MVVQFNRRGRVPEPVEVPKAMIAFSFRINVVQAGYLRLFLKMEQIKDWLETNRGFIPPPSPI